MKRTFRTISFLAITSSGTIIALMVIYYFQTKEIAKSSNWVMHTQSTIEEGYNLLSDTQRIQTSTQGYVITGQNEYLDSYHSATRAVYNDIEKLQYLAKDNAKQKDNLVKLQLLLDNKLNNFKPIIEIRKKHNFDYTWRFINQNKSLMTSNKVLSAKIAMVLGSILEEEKLLMQARSATLTAYLNKSNQIGLMTAFLSLMIILACLAALYRQLGKIKFAENKLQESKDELLKLAYFDPLTGLNNRSRLQEIIKESIDHAKLNACMAALFYLDVDNFKNTNDSFGHDVGDKILQAIAENLKTIANDSTVVFRVSGDEFLILKSNITQETEIALIAQNILDLFSKPNVINNHQIISTVSIGICIYPHQAKDEMAFLKNADIAMYKAKQLGKNNYQFCNDEMTLKFESRAALSQDLLRAVMHKEFVLAYQPKMSLTTEKPSGIEVLLRWHKPNGEIIYPATFIALAENNGLIIPIDEWVLYNMCAQANQWKNKGFEVDNVAVNVSIREFVLRDFASVITKLLRDTNFEPNHLEIEITESILMEDSASNFSALQYLKSLGIKITIDDFGTGYSSLSYLNSFPVDKLKIDKSFVAQIKPDTREPIIINAIISMAHNLGIQVIAEGVETQMQFDFLKHHQCDEIQGYYYSLPLSADELFQFYAKNDAIKQMQ